jgi:hypothetical protein
MAIDYGLDKQSSYYGVRRIVLLWAFAVLWKMSQALRKGRHYKFSFWDGGALWYGQSIERRKIILFLSILIFLILASLLLLIRVRLG